ncbi:MAG: alpha-L-fucosidase [Planctomycetota bacterium]|jgi:hypothetical protein
MNKTTDKLASSKWGVMAHFLASGAGLPEDSELTPEKWNCMVDNFNTAGLAEQLANIGAGYYMISIGQGSGYYCAPNPVYDQITGFSESKCSDRDLVSDLYTDLSRHGIKLLVYMPSDGSWGDFEAREKLSMAHHWNDFPNGDYDWSQSRQEQFMVNWDKILTCWSENWLEKVDGFWVDGCFAPEVRFPEDCEPNFKSMSRALKSGNPEAIVAYNSGVKIPVVSTTPEDDFTAGEIAHGLPECPGAFVEADGNKARFHILSYVGSDWGQGQEPRFTDELLRSYTAYVAGKGGFVTWDTPFEQDGSLPDSFYRHLESLKDLN